MPGRRSRRHGEREERRSRSRSPREGECPYRLELLAGRHEDPLPVHELLVELEGGGRTVIPHVCSSPDEGYVIRVSNDSRRHIACSVTVDGENALLRDGSLIVAPGDSRELPGFLVSKNFVGKEYVKEYRNFIFGKPKVVERAAGEGAKGDAEAAACYASYGRVKCDVFEAQLDEEVDSDQELRGQSSFYRGAGAQGSYDERTIEEGKKTHLLYSSVTKQGQRSSISNSTRGRWWVRGTVLLKELEVRYREAHSLMLMGVDPRILGLANCKEEHEGKETKDEREAKKEELEGTLLAARNAAGVVEVCDLTDDVEGEGSWSVQKLDQALAVEIDQPCS